MSLKFSPGNHRYFLDRKPVPGVTTILGVLNKPALPKWSATEVATWVADHPDAVDHLRRMGRAPMIAALRDVPWQKRDDAADRGTILHAFAEEILRGDPVTISRENVARHFAASGKLKKGQDADLVAEKVDLDDLAAVLDGAARFMDDWDITPLVTEGAVAHRDDWWAGTLDLIARYRHPRTRHVGVGIFDWKSGKAIYTEHAWQLNAYGHAQFGVDLAATPYREYRLPVVDTAIGVHIMPGGYAAHPVKYGPDVYEEFRVIRRLHTIHKAAAGDWRQPGTGHVGAAIEPVDE